MSVYNDNLIFYFISTRLVWFFLTNFIMYEFSNLSVIIPYVRYVTFYSNFPVKHLIKMMKGH